MSIPDELGFEEREVLSGEQPGEVSILTKMQKVLQMQCVDTILRVIVDKLVGDKQRVMGIRNPKAAKGEATRQTSDGSKKQVMDPKRLSNAFAM